MKRHYFRIMFVSRNNTRRTAYNLADRGSGKCQEKDTGRYSINGLLQQLSGTPQSNRCLTCSCTSKYKNFIIILQDRIDYFPLFGYEFFIFHS